MNTYVLSRFRRRYERTIYLYGQRDQLALSPQVDSMLTNILVTVSFISTVWGQACYQDYIIGRSSSVKFAQCPPPAGKNL